MLLFVSAFGYSVYRKLYVTLFERYEVCWNLSEEDPK